MRYDQKKIMVEEKIGVVLAILAGIFLCIASGIMFTNMVTRSVANFNIKTVYEVAQLSGAGVAAFTIPYATIKHAHTEMDIITSHLNVRVKNALEGLAGLITVAVMVFTVAMLISYAYQRTLTLETTTPNHLPQYLFRWIYAVGMLFTLIMAFVDMVDCFRVALGQRVCRTREELEAYQTTLTATADQPAVENDKKEEPEMIEAQEGGGGE